MTVVATDPKKKSIIYIFHRALIAHACWRITIPIHVFPFIYFIVFVHSYGNRFFHAVCVLWNSFRFSELHVVSFFLLFSVGGNIWLAVNSLTRNFVFCFFFEKIWIKNFARNLNASCSSLEWILIYLLKVWFVCMCEMESIEFCIKVDK